MTKLSWLRNKDQKEAAGCNDASWQNKYQYVSPAIVIDFLLMDQ